MEQQRLSPGRPSTVAALARVTGAGVVGTLATVAAVPFLIGAVFGAWTVALTAAAVLAAAVVAGLALVHRATGGDGRGLGWAALVAAGATLLSATAAAAWEVAGRDFGPEPLVWQGAVGAAFALCAAAGTRPTRLPACALLATVTLAALAQLGPVVTERLPSSPPRGCIATSAAEADARCP